MQNKLESFKSSDLLSQSPDVLAETCDKLAHVLLYGDDAHSDDPFSRMAEMILSQVLLHGALNAAKKKERGPYEPK